MVLHGVIVLATAAILVQSSVNVLGYQEDVPYHQNADDDSTYLYMDTRSLKDVQDKPIEYDIEARRRSILEKNFVRLGRRDPLLQQPNKYDSSEYDDYNNNYNDEYMMRPTRSGNDKNDNFVRFGRARSDFVRFGRDPSAANRLRGGNSFLRFGRSVQGKSRNKRDTAYADERDGSNANDGGKRSNTSFLRFGKSDHFMRFGRKEDDFTTTATVTNGNDHRATHRSLNDLMEVFREHPEYLLLLFRERQLMRSPSSPSSLSPCSSQF